MPNTLTSPTSYLDAPPAILVRPGTEVARRATPPSDLRWAVQVGTTLQEAARRCDRTDRTPRRCSNINAKCCSPCALDRVDAVMLDLPVALAYARAVAAARMRLPRSCPAKTVLAAALPKGSENLEAVDSAIRAFSADGTIERLGREVASHRSQRRRAPKQVPGLEDRRTMISRRTARIGAGGDRGHLLAEGRPVGVPGRVRDAAAGAGSVHAARASPGSSACCSAAM